MHSCCAFAFVPQEEKGSSGRKVRIQETVEAKPELALAYLEYLFSHTATREKVMALGEGPLKQLHAVLGSWRVRRMSSRRVPVSRPSLNDACLCSRCSTLT